MKRLVLAGLLTWVLTASAAQAQTWQPGVYVRPFQNRPTVSPYLNLFRGGSSGINYYSLVRPQIETYGALQQFQRQLTVQPEVMVDGALPLTGTGLPPDAVSTTGHPVSFFNYSHYFPGIANRGGIRTGATAGTAIGAGGTYFPQPGVGVGIIGRR